MILAIDFGSTSFKTGLFDRKLQQVGGGSALVRYQYASGGRVELAVPVAEAALRQALACRQLWSHMLDCSARPCTLALCYPAKRLLAHGLCCQVGPLTQGGGSEKDKDTNHHHALWGVNSSSSSSSCYWGVNSSCC